MNEAPLMLGVSGLRGIVGRSLTPEVAARYAAALGAWLSDRRSRAGGKPRRLEVIVAWDGRAGADAIVEAAVAGLLASGCDVLRIGVAMTPTVGTVMDALGAPAGLQITASHNPQEWNGLKILLREPDLRPGKVGACAPDAATANQIIARFRAAEPPYVTWDRVGAVTTESGHDEAHGSAVAEAIDRVVSRRKIKNREFHVVLDSVGGSGGVWTRAFLERDLGCNVDQLGEYADGVFTHTPEPTRENLGGLCKAVRRTKAGIGFAQDPDADRLAIVDERGRYIGEEYTLALAAESVLSAIADGARRGRGDLVLAANLSTSRMIDDIATRYGARVVRTAVGEANVVEAMKREKAAGHRVVLGGEGNGGIIWPEVTYVRDSLSGMALVLALMARTGKTVSELVAGIPVYAIEKRKVEIARKEDAGPAAEKIARAYRDQKIDRQDGVRVDWPDRRAWLHVRASNTEPIMRLIAEAPTQAEAAAILDEAARLIGS